MCCGFRRAVTVIAVAAVFVSTGYFDAAAQTSSSKVATHPSLTVPVEEKSDLSKALARGAEPNTAAMAITATAHLTALYTYIPPIFPIVNGSHLIISSTISRPKGTCPGLKPKRP